MEKRRSALKKMLASIAGLSVLGISKNAIAEEKVVNNVTTLQRMCSLFSGSTKFGNLIFIAGKEKAPIVEHFRDQKRIPKSATEIARRRIDKGRFFDGESA